MKEQALVIGQTPALLLGEPSTGVVLFVHGQGGSKAEARLFAQTACPLGWQVLGIDLPGHGQRTEEAAFFDPWHVVPELRQVLQFAQAQWKRIALRTNSIGSWFSLLAFAGQPLEKCLMVSPLVDMERMIFDLMGLAHVTEEQLEREKIIPTDYGQTLSWEYLGYVRAHPVTAWDVPTWVLRAEKDEMIPADTVERFCSRFQCRLTTMPGGEHWFHTDDELTVLRRWEAEALQG